MSQQAILYPSIVMALFTLTLLGSMGVRRFRAVGRGEVDPRYYKAFAGGQETPALHILGRHVQNHFEVPPLFHAVVLATYATDSVTTASIALAWAFVALRGLHTWIHLGRNVVIRRFLAFGAGVVVLVAMWVALAIELLGRPAG